MSTTAQLDPSAPASSRMSPLLIGAIGVVYGDIGTSPLYTLRQCFTGSHQLDLSQANVLGILSIIFWALMIVVTLKYVALIMRADNRGEGGILALTALVVRGLDPKSRQAGGALMLGIFGAAMFYGDGMITPAISVLGAVEGLEIIAPHLDAFIVPLAIVILVALFAIQRNGTALVGALFGPVMCVWFVTLALLGCLQIARNPDVVAAINPAYAWAFVFANPGIAFLALGAVVLAVTGTEALYADMGHFGKAPIRRAWLFFVMPALVLNYFGQGALLLADADAIRNPFYLLAPNWAMIPLVVLASCAAVIASQAVISGAFSLTRAAIQMGYCPRLEISHTSARQIGQIYVPFVNWILFIAVIGLVVGFQRSDNLGGAYGIAVTLAMLIDTILIVFVMRRMWRWSTALAMAVATPLFLIDVSFFTSNALKIPDGGWFPLVIGALVFTLLTTWKQGRSILMQRLSDGSIPLDMFIQSIALDPPVRVPGTAVFLTSALNNVPNSMLHNLKHNKVLHERVVFLTITTLDIPRVDSADRFEIKQLGPDFFQIIAAYGFTEDPDVPRLLEECKRAGLQFNVMETSFFVSRETLIASGTSGISTLRERLFVSMSKNAIRASDFFSIPTNRVVEVGTQVEI
jgi:KUP system potassium uptake protein